LSALVSPLPNASWGRLAQEFLSSRHDPSLLRVFVNTALGEPWRPEEDAGPDEGDLVSRCEDIGLENVPAEVVLLTCGCDIQDDRVEVSTIGFDRIGTVYVLEHAILYGRPLDEKDDVWADLSDHLRRRFQHPKGGTLAIDATVIDASDGDSYNQVLAFCQARHGKRVLAGKGAAGMSRPPLTIAKKTRRGGRLHIIGVDPLKSRVFGMLASPGRIIRFSRSLAGGDYFDQLLAERKVTRMVRGRPIVRFERRQGARSEALDCLAYGLAARAALTLDLDAREKELRQETLSSPPARKPPEVIRSNWMGR